MFIKPNDQDLRILVHLAREVETYLDATQAAFVVEPIPTSEVRVNLGGSPGEVLRRFQHYMDSKFREQVVANSHIRSNAFDEASQELATKNMNIISGLAKACDISRNEMKLAAAEKDAQNLSKSVVPGKLIR